MSNYEAFPDLEPIDLYDDELAEFVKTNIWPAAGHLWGEDYVDPQIAPHLEPRIVKIDSQDDDGKVELSFSPELEAQFCADGEVDESLPPDLYLRVELCAYRPDLTGFFERKFHNGIEVWESCVYDFYVKGTLHEADRFYMLKDSDGEPMDGSEVTSKQRKELKRIDCHPRYASDRGAEMTTQDIIDVHNVLLALDIPENVISLP
jgi:hypothetical protein